MTKEVLKRDGHPCKLFAIANDFVETEDLVSEHVKAFRELQVEQSVSFEVIRKTGWCKELLKISEDSTLLSCPCGGSSLPVTSPVCKMAVSVYYE